MIGSTLSHFKITAKLGEGGMGEVYRATDTKLDREVAIKVLPEAFTADSERLARFEREAKVLASLNHANIAGIHQVEHVNGVHFLVMELVEGEDLAARLSHGAIPVDELLPLASQIANALEEAHARGIVHRDLKPANIKVTENGTVKVLDFGLAKAWQTDVEQENADLTNSPTLTASMTGAGVILGTAAYMSPEQALGREADQRSDVWSFGVVIYEMLTGSRAFKGKDVPDTLAAVIRGEIDWSRIPIATPDALARMLQRCLQRDPDGRLHAVADARLELEDALEGVPGQPSSARAGVARRETWAWLVAAAALSTLGVLILGGGLHVTEELDPRLPIRFAVQLPPHSEPSGEVEAHDLALSPDGTRLAFVASVGGVRQAWIRRIDEDDLHLVPGSENAHSLFWSPTGDRLAFFDTEALKVHRLRTGTTEMLTQAIGAKTGAWSSRGDIVFAQTFSDADGLYRVAETGGAQELLEASDEEAGPGGHRWPEFLPDGERFLYLAYILENGTPTKYLHVGDLVSGVTRPLFPFQWRVEISREALLYVRQHVLVARPFDFDSLSFSGEEIVVAQEVPDFFTGWAPFTTSPGGTTAYRAELRERTIRWYDRTGRELGEVAESGQFRTMALSPNGKKLALEIEREGNTDLWIRDLERDVLSRLTSGDGFESFPVWAPDGRELVFGQHGIRKREDYGLYIRDAEGVEVERSLGRGSTLPYPTDWSADGRWIVYWDFAADTGEDLWLRPMTGDETAFPRLQTKFREMFGTFSGDSRWLAYASDESGRFEIYVAPIEGRGKGVPVSSDGGFMPRWNGSKEIIYTIDGAIVAAPLEVRDGELRPGTPERLFEVPTGSIEWIVVAPDGERILVMSRADPQRSIHVIVN